MTHPASIAPAWELALPWPSKDLSPNARVHWAVRANKASLARTEAWTLALHAGWLNADLPDGRLHLWITFRPPTKRLPDDDNMLARFKAYRDGIADALGIDDKRFISHPYVSDKPVRYGEVRVRITEGPSA